MSALAVILCGCQTRQDTSAGKRVESLDSNLWNMSQWISATDAPVVEESIGELTRAADGSSWFVTNIINNRKLKKAKWMTTGLGIFDLYVNGKRIGEEILKPGFTDYEKTKRSFTYDITEAMNPAENASNQLAVEMTPGWWGDKIVTPGGTQGFIGKKVAFRGVVELTYTDGTKEYFGSNNKDWKAGITGPVKHAAIFDGEEYDARVQPGYMTEDLLSTPEVNFEFNGEILPSQGAEVYLRKDLALPVKRAYLWENVTGQNEEDYGTVVITKEFAQGEELTVKPGETLVLDFGQNSSAVPSFEFLAEEGTKLTFLPAELLNDGNGSRQRGMDGPEGSIHRLNLRTPDTAFRVDYTFADNKGKYSNFIPTKTFFGYRYASIVADGDVKIRNIKSIPVTSITKDMEIGKISTGNDTINRLISNTYWGQLSNYLSVPTDCPQRNERLGWMADTQVFSETGTYFANTRDFFDKWMRDVRDNQSPAGGYPGVCPKAQYGHMPHEVRLGWADAGIIVPWTVWKQFDDKSIIDNNWESMERFMDLISDTKYNHNALIEHNGNYQWADWLSYEPLETCGGLHIKHENGQDVINPDAIEYWNYLGACYWLSDAEMMADMARATDRDNPKYEQMVSKARDYIKNEFFTPDGKFKTEILNTMQTPALFALRGNLVEGQAKEDMISRLRENFANNGNCLQTGFLGTSILMPTLTENGMTDLAYTLLFQRNNPSWIYSVDNGATTIWERWNSYMIDKGMGPRGMNSFNHYAYGCVCEWLWETAAGISTDNSYPGFKHIVMKPVPDKRLGHLDAVYNSTSGPIESHWKYEGDNWIWDFSIPEGATASVTLPWSTDTIEYGAGNHRIQHKIN